MSKFYFLLKIHKPGNLGGPIVFACNCPTELIATYLDAITTPLDKTLPSFVNDTNYKHMLYIAKSFRFPNFKSLYINIPNRDGLLAFQHFLHKRAIPQPSTHTLVRLAEQVLTLNSLLKWEVLESNRGGGLQWAADLRPSTSSKSLDSTQEPDPTYVKVTLKTLLGLFSVTKIRSKILLSS